MNNPTKYIIEKSRIQLSFMQTIGYYSIAVLPMILPISSVYIKFTETQVVNTIPLLFHIIAFALSGFIIYLKHKELIVERVYETRSSDQFKEAVLATANRMNWNIESLDTISVNAIAPNTGFWKSWELSKISISRNKKYVEIRSMYSMFLSSPDFTGVNKEHRRTFLRNYILTDRINNLNEQTLNEIKEEEKRLYNEPEWNIKNTSKRIFCYVFSIGFLTLGIALYKYEGLSIMVPILIILGLFYIVIDLKILLEKRNKPTHNNAS